MKSLLIFVLSLILGTLCQSTGNALQERADLRITRAWSGGDSRQAPGGDWLEVTNNGAVMIDITNYWVCSNLRYSQISTNTIRGVGDFMLGPGESVQFYAGVEVSPNADLELYFSNNFADGTQIITLLQFGVGGPFGRTSLAVGQGLWSAATDIIPPLPDLLNNYQIIGTPAIPLSPANYINSETGQVQQNELPTNPPTGTTGTGTGTGTATTSTDDDSSNATALASSFFVAVFAFFTLF